MWSDENIFAHTSKQEKCFDLEHLNFFDLKQNKTRTAGTFITELSCQHLEPHLVAGCSMGCVHISHL